MSPFRKRPHKVNIIHNTIEKKYKAHCVEGDYDSKECDTKEEAESEGKTHGRLV
jgi:hypothetical protein